VKTLGNLGTPRTELVMRILSTTLLKEPTLSKIKDRDLSKSKGEKPIILGGKISYQSAGKYSVIGYKESMNFTYKQLVNL